METKVIKGYSIEPKYSERNQSGLLHITKDGSSIRELYFPCEGQVPTDNEINQAIQQFFNQLVHEG